MSKDELRKLWDERERISKLVSCYAMANVNGLADDQKFDLDIEYRQTLDQWGKADRAYKNALDEYGAAVAI